MDAMQFDQLARSLSAGTRRGILAFVATLPILSGVAAFLALDEEAGAKGRRKRRKKRHKHGKGNGRHRKGKRRKRCRKKSRARICAGKCGIVKNKKTCNKKVNCGPCACDPPCPVCQVCDEAAGACGAVCEGTGCCDGAECQSGDSNGACGKDGDVCAVCAGTTPICVNNICTACSTTHPCPSGQLCDAGACLTCDVCANECDFASVQEAITAASAGDTIRVCPGTYGAITIDKSLTLIGAGQGVDSAGNTILDAAGNGRVVEINAGVAASLWALRITGGNASSGAGVRNEGSLTMSACTVHENVAMFFGGGLVNSGAGPVTLTGCTVSKNTAPGYGGIDHTGSGALTLDHTIVSGNTASGQDGGGLRVRSASAYFTNGSAITGNTAADDGGGLYVEVHGSVSFDSRCSVTGNTAANGGGIYLLSGDISLNGATVKDNTPNDCIGLTC